MSDIIGRRGPHFLQPPARCEADGTLTTLGNFILLCRTLVMVASLDPDKDATRITVRFTTEGKLMGAEVDDGLADWL